VILLYVYERKKAKELKIGAKELKIVAKELKIEAKKINLWGKLN